MVAAGRQTVGKFPPAAVSDACLSGTPVRQCSRFVGFCRPVEGIFATTAQVKISAPAGDTFHPGLPGRP